MNKNVIITVATVSSAVVLGAATLGGFTVGLTHSANPLNIKIRSDFNHLKVSDDKLNSQNFNNVRRFVNANGRGTLIAKKINKSGDLEFKYYQHGEMVDVSKEDVLSRDWKAVRQYIDFCGEYEKKCFGETAPKPGRSETEKNQNTDLKINASAGEESDKTAEQTCGDKTTEGNNAASTIIIRDIAGKSNKTENGGDTDDAGEYEESDTGSVVFHDVSSGDVDTTPVNDNQGEELEDQISVRMEEVFNRFGLNKARMDEILRTFYETKRKFITTRAYLGLGTKFGDFLPKGRRISFLQAHNESAMNKAFYGETDWSTWKTIIEKSVGNRDVPPNPVVQCYYWCRFGNNAAELGKKLNLSAETVLDNVRLFVQIFYSLTGAEERVNEVLEEIATNNGGHKPTESDIW